jgi:hypothetical protein
MPSHDTNHLQYYNQIINQDTYFTTPPQQKPITNTETNRSTLHPLASQPIRPSIPPGSQPRDMTHLDLDPVYPFSPGTNTTSKPPYTYHFRSFPSPQGIWSTRKDTEKISMAPALRMTRIIKEKLVFFFPSFSLFTFTFLKSWNLLILFQFSFSHSHHQVFFSIIPV